MCEVKRNEKKKKKKNLENWIDGLAFSDKGENLRDPCAHAEEHPPVERLGNPCANAKCPPSVEHAESRSNRPLLWSECKLDKASQFNNHHYDKRITTQTLAVSSPREPTM